MILIMLGAQGTGKGTVAGLISKETGLLEKILVKKHH